MNSRQAFKATVVLLDGLVGIGVTGALRGTLADVAWEMNELRRRALHAVTVALDIPSGLDPETGDPVDPIACRRILTITGLAHVKDMLLADAVTTSAVGRLAIVPWRELDGRVRRTTHSDVADHHCRSALLPMLCLEPSL